MNLRSFINLKPSSTPSNSKLPSLIPDLKRVNFFSQALQSMSTVLSYLSLVEIYRIFVIFTERKAYSKCGKSSEIENEIVRYLLIARRRYKTKEEREFVSDFLPHISQLCTFEYFVDDKQMSEGCWFESIILDVERTYPSLTNLDDKQSCSIISSPRNVRKGSQLALQVSKNQQQKVIKSHFHISRNSSNSLFQDKQQNPMAKSSLISPSINCNFLSFSYGHEGLSRSVKPQNSRKLSLESKVIDDEAKRQQLKQFLLRVLSALSKRFPEMHYIQGFHYWISQMHDSGLNEEQSFWLASYILQKMEGQFLFRNDLIKVRELCFVFEIYLFNNLPTLFSLLKKNEVSSTIYASNWFITLFAEQLPTKTVNKLWHLFLLKGWKMLIKFSVALMCVFEKEIRSVEGFEIFKMMRGLLSNLTKQKEEQLWKIMGSIKCSNKMLKYLSTEMRYISNDTEIQLWRLENQRREAEKISNYKPPKANIFSCQLTDTCVDSEFYPSGSLIQTPKKSSYNLRNYGNKNSPSRQPNSIVNQQQNSIFLSFCQTTDTL